MTSSSGSLLVLSRQGLLTSFFHPPAMKVPISFLFAVRRTFYRLLSRTHIVMQAVSGFFVQDDPSTNPGSVGAVSGLANLQIGHIVRPCTHTHSFHLGLVSWTIVPQGGPPSETKSITSTSMHQGEPHIRPSSWVDMAKDSVSGLPHSLVSV